ncbi:MAG TPA: DUF167 domain-containing protein [Burkholderiales bacterium]|nr:DUF167 domain-containing protein [Burkholderiales bacterium]
MPAENAWCRFDSGAGRITLTVHVQPNARTSEIAGLHGDALRIRVAAPAVDNKANAALIDFLHRFLKLPPSLISIRHGVRGRRKVVEIARADAAMHALISNLAEDQERLI